MRPAHRIPFTDIGLGLWLLFAVTVLAIVLANVPYETMDFHGFYESGLAWREGRADSGQAALVYPNLNPPTLAPIVAPLTYLPLRVAFWIWTTIGTLLLVDAVRLAVRARGWSRRRLLFVTGALLATLPAIGVWTAGQLTWVLAWLLTRAWLASSPARAGLWLAPAIAVKPPLALMALLLPWPLWGVAGAVSAGLTLAAVALTGWGAWSDWLSLSGRVTWLGWVMNGSLWGWAIRIGSWDIPSATMRDVPAATIGIISALGAAAVWLTTRTGGDRRWAAALVTSLLVAPLGWVYYLPAAVGPLGSAWRWSAKTVTAVALLTVPIPVLARLAGGDVLDPVINSSYALGMALVWWSLIASDRS